MLNMTCAVEGCEAPAKKRGWCYSHYNRWHYTGSPTATFSQPTDPAKAREFIAAGKCPYCGRGPFRVVAGHARRAHGIDKRRLRDDAGLLWSASICDPEHAELMRQMAVERDTVSVMAGKQRSGTRNAASCAAVESQRANGAAAGERRRRIPVSDFPLIVARWNAGESGPAIAATYGVTANRIRQIVKTGR